MTSGDNYDAGRVALQRIDTHERVCAERYEQIKQNQAEAKTERQRQHKENKDQMALVGARIDRLYNRAWTVAGTIIGFEGAIIAAIIAYVMKKVMEGGMP